jgi:thiosulfate dehydrogenase (quinone) large subunit
MTKFQTGAIVGLRLLVGWHFLYEGVAKLANPYWTSAGYLAESQWIFQDLLVRIAANPTAVTVVDYMNMWGLTLIGLGLILGLFTRTAAVAGIVLLAFYYLSAPPLTGLSYPMPMEGSYLIVNKVLIELAALVVLLGFPTGRTWGLDFFLTRGRAAPSSEPAVEPAPETAPEPREPVHA